MPSDERQRYPALRVDEYRYSINSLRKCLSLGINGRFSDHWRYNTRCRVREMLASTMGAKSAHKALISISCTAPVMR